MGFVFGMYSDVVSGRIAYVVRDEEEKAAR